MVIHSLAIFLDRKQRKQQNQVMWKSVECWERLVYAFKSTSKVETYKEALVSKPSTLEIVLEQKERGLEGKVLSIRYARVWKYKHKWNTYSYGKRPRAGVPTEKPI